MCRRQKADLILSVFLREGYNNPQVSGENLIGLSRARRPHSAIFVNFDDKEVPAKPLDAAVQTWKKVCTNPVDKKVEEELRKVRTCLTPGLSTVLQHADLTENSCGCNYCCFFEGFVLCLFSLVIE